MSGDHISQAIEAARRYVTEHPDDARSPDRPAVAMIERGLRCRVEGPGDAPLFTDMPAARVV